MGKALFRLIGRYSGLWERRGSGLRSEATFLTFARSRKYAAKQASYVGASLFLVI